MKKKNLTSEMTSSQQKTVSSKKVKKHKHRKSSMNSDNESQTPVKNATCDTQQSPKEKSKVHNGTAEEKRVKKHKKVDSLNSKETSELDSDKLKKKNKKKISNSDSNDVEKKKKKLTDIDNDINEMSQDEPSPKKRKISKKETEVSASNDSNADEPLKKKKKKEKEVHFTKEANAEDRVLNQLFVGCLSKDTTEADLKVQFPTALSVTIHIKKKGVRFAFVEFKSDKEAEKARKTAEGSEVKGRKITIDYVKKENAKSNAAERLTLFAGNLPKDVSESEVKNHFPGAVSVRLRKDKKGNAFAFVEFKSAVDAKLTLEEKQGLKIKGSEIKLDYVAQGSKFLGDKSNTMIVSNITSQVRESDLKKIFTEATGVQISRGNDGSVKGTAFITFPSKEAVKSTIESKQRVRLKGKRLRLSSAAKGKKKVKSKEKYCRTLKVSNFSASSSELKKHFPGCVHVKLPQLNDGRPKEFAFIEFKTESEADKAMAKKQRSILNGQKIQLKYVGAKRNTAVDV